jgi:hypothetical protein
MNVWGAQKRFLETVLSAQENRIPGSQSEMNKGNYKNQQNVKTQMHVFQE